MLQYKHTCPEWKQICFTVEIFERLVQPPKTERVSSLPFYAKGGRRVAGPPFQANGASRVTIWPNTLGLAAITSPLCR